MTYSWSKDGRYVLFDGFAINVETGKQTAFSGEPGFGGEAQKRGKSTELPSFSPDGKRIIFSAPQGPKLVTVENGSFVYDTSTAYEPLKGLHHISWIGD